jgi:LacI family gluconate utilization system Gnt-I transcriptional repressor
MSTRSPSRPKVRKVSAAKLSMEDVARIAGVTAMTVSRALNTPQKVAAETRAKVEQAIAQIGYVHNLTASSLASKKSRIVAALVPTIGASIFAETVRGLSETLAAEGYQLLLGQTGYDEAVEESLVSALLGRGVDGIVLTGVSHSGRTITQLKAAGIPVVETWDLTPSPIDMVAGFSNEHAGREVGRYLLGKGYRQIGFAGGGGDRTGSRLKGLRAAVKRVRGASVTHVSLPVASSFHGGREALALVLESNREVEAIFFVNDALAVGALMECMRRGIRVPRDLAIVGFADIDIAAEVEPALTTVQVRSRNIGEQAAAMLLSRFKGQAVDAPVRDLGFVLVPRASA